MYSWFRREIVEDRPEEEIQSGFDRRVDLSRRERREQSDSFNRPEDRTSWGEPEDDFGDRVDTAHREDNVHEDDFQENGHSENDSASSKKRKEEARLRRYLLAIGTWTKEETADNAAKLADAKKSRLSLIHHIAKDGNLAHPSLQGDDIVEYVAADLAEMNQTRPQEGEYAGFLRARAKIHDRLFGEGAAVDAETYAKAVNATQDAITEQDYIGEQYSMLDVRRDAVQEHFDDPRFIARVALVGGESLKDELFRDFDRKDLDNKHANYRSTDAAELFSMKLGDVKSSGSSTASRVSAFMELRAIGAELAADPGTIFKFAYRHENDPVGLEAGLSAMEEKPFGASTVADFWNSYDEEKRAEVIKATKDDPAKLFSYARKKFEEDLIQGNPSLSTSFSVMEKSAKKVLSMGGAHVYNLAVDGSSDRLEDAAVLQQFSGSQVAEKGEAAVEKFEEELQGNLEFRSSLRETRTRSERDETQKSLLADGREVQFDVAGNDRPEIRVVDGSHIAISHIHEGFKPVEELSEISKSLGKDLTNAEVVRSFLNEDTFSASFNDGKVTAEDLVKVNLSETEAKSLLKGKARKDERVAMAFKMGLGEAVLEVAGVGPEEFAKLGKGEVSVDDISKKLKEAGITDATLSSQFGPDALKNMGLGRKRLSEISKMNSANKGKLAYREIIATDATFRLHGITAPKDGVMTKDGKDAGALSKDQLEGILQKYGHDALDFEFGRSKDGTENTATVRLQDGRFVSDVMLQRGYALPLDDEAGARQEKFAQMAESRNKGLWALGMPEEDPSWRRDLKSPSLSALDKRERLFKTVGASMAGSASQARRMLEDKNVQLFALPLEDWSNANNVTRELDGVAKGNPKKLLKVYDNNMEILRDLRKRNKEGRLTEEEKLAHDRLSVGRRAMAESLIPLGALSKEQAMEDSHKLLSQKSTLFPAGFREKFVKTAEKSVQVAEMGARKVLSGARTVTNAAMDFALGA